MATVSWQPSSGELLAVPVETEVRVYQRGTWECVATLADSAHIEVMNVVSWRGCGQFLACAGVDGVVSVWDYSNRSVSGRYRNESGIGITSLEWYPDTEESERDGKAGLYFADNEGYIGWFQGAEPTVGGRGSTKGVESTDDPLADDSLLMEGIPPDAIFGTDDIMDGDDEVLDGAHDDEDETALSGSHSNLAEDDDIIHSRKRRRLLEDSDDEGETESNAAVAPDDVESLISGDVGPAPSRPLAPPTSIARTAAAAFSEKFVEVYQSPLLPSSTPHTLPHHFLTYNMVGVVRSHNDDDTHMIEVEFHNSTVHHSFSIPNHHGNNMASLSESCLALACQRNEGNPSQLQCLHLSTWDSGNKEWSLSLPAKESATGLSLGNGWVAVATDKQLLRVFSLGGMQRDVLCVAGVIVGVAGWGSRLAVVYQEPPCTEKVFQLKVWVLDVVKRKQLFRPHSLPLSLHSKLDWFGSAHRQRLKLKCFRKHSQKEDVWLPMTARE
ncbi:WD repeat and HMG-box DNA-binding protein 1 [Geodia barretti]|nr:WD repeat and HMG-box DNA-binding protein 1 [Geodia barretti]